MAPQTKVRHGWGAGQPVPESGSDEDEGGSSDDEPTFKGEQVRQEMQGVFNRFVTPLDGRVLCSVLC